MKLHLFQLGNFVLHSGLKSGHKIDCDAVRFHFTRLS